MAQFGTGPELAAQCPHVPPPDGWRPWTPEIDGPVPLALSNRAQSVASDQTIVLGSTESYPLPGITALIRVEPRVWAYDSQGALAQGCFRTGGVYLPSSDSSGDDVIAPPSNPDSLSRTVGILTAASLSIGIIATLATWKRRK